MKKMNIYELAKFNLETELKKGGFSYTLTGRPEMIERAVTIYVNSLPESRLIESNLQRVAPQLVKNARILYTGTGTPHLYPELVNMDIDYTNSSYSMLLFFRTDDGFRSEINLQLREIQKHSAVVGIPEICAAVEAGKYVKNPSERLKKDIAPILNEMDDVWDKIKRDITIWCGALRSDPKTREFSDTAVPVISHYARTVNELNRNLAISEIVERRGFSVSKKEVRLDQNALFRRQLYFEELEHLEPKTEKLLSVICDSGNPDCFEITEEMDGMLTNYMEEVTGELN